MCFIAFVGASNAITTTFITCAWPGSNEPWVLYCFLIRRQTKHDFLLFSLPGSKVALRLLCCLCRGQTNHHSYCVFCAGDTKSITYTKFSLPGAASYKQKRILPTINTQKEGFLDIEVDINFTLHANTNDLTYHKKHRSIFHYKNRIVQQ